MTHAHNVRVSARTAEITADASDEDSGGNWRFGGVAVGENDILYTDDGKPVLFTPEVLAEYAETQAGEPLTVDHPTDEDGNPVYPPPLEETPGKVPKAGYVPGQGLVYEATTHDESLANGVKGGSYEVSVHPTFDLGEKDPDTGAYIPENVDFLDLSVVSKGMSASNTAEWGANAALASWTRQADIGAELDAHEPASDSEDLVSRTVRKTLSALGFSNDELIAQEADPEDSRLPQVGDAVRWNSGAGGEREPDDVRYGVVVDGLQDESDDVMLVAVYQPDSDYEGWESRNEENTMDRENLEVVGDSGVDSLPSVSQVTASAMPDTPEDGGGEETATASDGDTLNEEPDSSMPNADGDADADDDDSTMTDDDTPEETPDEQPDDESGEEPESDTETGTETESESEDEQTLGDMTVDELGAALREQGFVTEDNATEFVEQAHAQKDKAEKVDEIIASSDDYDEDDRDDLMASADSLVENEHDRLTTAGGAKLPGATGTRASVTASATDEDDDLVETFGTGVQE